MNTNFARLFYPTTLIAFTILFFSSNIGAQSDHLVTAASAGPIKIGMTISEARSVLPGMTFEQIEDGDGVPLMAVKKGGDLYFTLYAGQETPEKPIASAQVIEQIEVWASSYKSKDGVGPATLVIDAEKKYGAVKSIGISEIESRQYIEFVNGPAEIGFKINYCGTFSRNQRKTTQYEKGCNILSLIIAGDGSESNVGFFSEYTDLEKECKTPDGQGEEGGHVSSYCEGPDKWRVHMFDTAMTLEITVQSEESRESISIARESLSFTTKGKKLEWRFKYGEPFAVILRGNKYKTDENGLIKYPAEVTGEYLFVRGLPAFESINADVNVRTTKFANEEARRVADEGYVGVKFPTAKEYLEIDTSDYNLSIVLAANKGESWVKSPMQVALKLVGDFEEMQMRKMIFDAPTGDGFDTFKLTVVSDGLLDDSVKSERWMFELAKGTSGVWKVSSAKKSWACWPGRGHAEFSAVPCL